MHKILTLFLAIMILCIPTMVCAEENQTIQENAEETIYTKAKVIETGEVFDREIGGIVDKIQKVTIEILEGEFAGRKFEANYILSYDIDNKIMAYELDIGNTVSVALTLAEGEIKEIVVQDVIRQDYILWMLIVFLVSVLIIGRKQGLKAILGLVVTILAVYFIMIQSIYCGYSPIVVSIITSIGIILVTFMIISGINKKAITAAIGTAGGVILSGGVAFAFGVLAKLSGGQEEAIMLSMNAGHITFNFRELLFAGIVVASLGACMDVGMSIASSLDELKQKNPHLTWKELFKSGMNIGGDVIGTMTNTLILAYVGGALNLILLFMACDMSIYEIINKETIAADIISALAGSMGVIYTIPTTASIYALFNRKRTTYKTKPETKVEGKRSLKI